MQLPTERVYFSCREVDMVVPGLECLLNRFADASRGRYRFRDPKWALSHPEICSVPFDNEIYDKVLYARNCLRSINNRRQVRFNCLEIAAVQVALRLVRREKLVFVQPEEFVRFGQKLEKYRKRARRAAGEQRYENASRRWHQLLGWMHVHIFHFRPPRWSSPSTMLRREQREQTRRLALSMVEPNVDPSRVSHLADLARREVRRGRHGTTLRALLAADEKAVPFFKMFLLKRLGPEAMKPEFQPDCVIAAERGEKFQAAAVVQVE